MTFSLAVQRSPRVAKRAKRLDDHHADFTPQGGALICCHAVNDLLFGGARYTGRSGVICEVSPGSPRRPTSIIDPTAGGGPFGWAARKVWPGILSVGNDIREEEAEDIAANYDQAFAVDFRELAEHTGRCDLLLTNPPFKLAADVWEAGHDQVTHGGWICLFVRITLGDDADVCRRLWGSQVERVGRSGFRMVERDDHHAELRRPDAVIEFSNRFRFREGVNPKNGKPYGSDSTTYRIICRRVDDRPRQRLAPVACFKLDRMDDRLFSWLVGSDGAPIRPGEEWRRNDPAAEAMIADLARRSWEAHR